MRDDIVTRLRNWHTEHDSAFPRPIDLEAADEIERLRADRDRWQKIATFELEMQGYDNIEEHIAKCYSLDGRYHGGSE